MKSFNWNDLDLQDTPANAEALQARVEQHRWILNSMAETIEQIRTESVPTDYDNLPNHKVTLAEALAQYNAIALLDPHSSLKAIHAAYPGASK